LKCQSKIEKLKRKSKLSTLHWLHRSTTRVLLLVLKVSNCFFVTLKIKRLKTGNFSGNRNYHKTADVCNFFLCVLCMGLVAWINEL